MTKKDPRLQLLIDRHFKKKSNIHGEISGFISEVNTFFLNNFQDSQKPLSINNIDFFNASWNDLFFLFDSKGFILRSNDACSRLLGYPIEKIIGTHFSEFIPEPHKQRIIEFYTQQYIEKIPFSKIQFPTEAVDGRLIWLEQHTNTIFEDGEVTGYLCIARDVTDKIEIQEQLEKSKYELGIMVSKRTEELRNINRDLQKEIEFRMRAEEELKSSEKHLADIINCLPEPTFAIDREGRVIAWNYAIEKLTNIHEEDIIGRGDYEYAIPFYGEKKPILIDYVLCQDKDILEKYSVIDFADDSPIAETYIKGLRPEGSYLWEQAKPLYDSSGLIIGCVATLRDITERKKSEDRMREITKQALYHQIALQGISRLDNSDFKNAVLKITETTSKALDIERTAVWLFSDEMDDLICRDQYITSKNTHHRNLTLKASNYKLFIKTITNLNHIHSNDAIEDMSLCEFSEPFLKPNRIYSAMYLPIRLSGKVAGFLACESVAERREWSIEEQEFASSIADILALSLEATERRRAQDALQEQIKFTANLIENLAVPVFVIDREGIIMLWNKACELLTAKKSSDMIGTSNQWMAFYDHERPTLTDLVLRQTFDGVDELYSALSPSAFIENGWHAEGWYDSIGGKNLYMLFDAIPIFNNKNEIIASVEILQDITQLKNAERETIKMRAFLKNIIDSMPSVLIGVDTEGKIIHWNSEAEKTTGVTEDQAQGKNLTEIYPFLKDQMDKVTRAITERRTQKTERLQHGSDSDSAFSDIIVYPLISNGVQGAVIRVDDITSRVRIEEMMVQTEKMMSVGGLAAGMAHEINNPLGGIMLGAQNLQRRLSSELSKNYEVAEECGIDIMRMKSYMEKREIFEILKGILSMGERASKIVANMLSFSRKSDSKKNAVRINDLIDRTLELAANDYDLKRKYDFRQIEIFKEYQEPLPDLICSPTEVQQVVLNLLKNAAQSMFTKLYPEGEKPRISIRLKENRSMIKIEIEDNGPGMEERTKKRVFEPFFTTKEVGTGTGLGLSVSYFIITDNHGGTMDLISTIGKGTTFIIQLPIIPK